MTAICKLEINSGRDFFVCESYQPCKDLRTPVIKEHLAEEMECINDHKFMRSLCGKSESSNKF